MGQVNYRELGQNGISLDTDPAELPVGFITGGINIISSFRGINLAPGYEASAALPGVEPSLLLPESNAEVAKIHVFGGQSSYLVDPTTPIATTNIGGYSVPIKWTAISHKEVVYASNGVDALQFFNEATSKFENVPGFPAATSFQCIRRYKDYLIGVGVNENGVSGGEEIYWSHPTILGQTPASWDITDPAYDAGRLPLPTPRGVLRDGLELGEYFIAYKSDSIWAISYVGGNAIFRRSLITNQYGLLCQGAVCAYPGGHFFCGQSGFYTYNGQGLPKGIGTGRVNDTFFNQLDSENYEKTFLLHIRDRKEVWVYYPSAGSTHCDKAFVWNYELDSWGQVEVSSVIYACISEDISVGERLRWNQMGDTTWQASGRWVEQINRQYVPVVYEAHYSAAETLPLFNHTDLGLREGVIPSWSVERKDFLLGPFSARGNVIQDYETQKIISEIWIRMIANGTFNVYVGGRDNESDPVEWDTPVVFDPSADSKVDVFITKRFHALRIENIDSSSIILQGINIRFENGGDF